MEIGFNKYVIFIILLFVNQETYCGTLLGRAALLYTSTGHQIFRDQQSVIGLVRISDGFTVATPASGAGSSHDASLFMDTCLSVSGAIDLRNTNSLVLLSDLRLESGVTFSARGGFIYGYDHALILNGNLNIPADTVLHFSKNTIIEGQGNTLNLGDNSQLFVDTDATLTLRNLVVRNSKNGVGNPAIKLASSGSRLALDNSILDMTGDFYFNRGSLFIHNDVIFTGTNALVYCSCQPSFITSGATFMFDLGTTFSFSPSTFTVCPYTTSQTYTSNNFIKMQDSSSKIIFNGCDFYTTLTGLMLTTGEVDFDNKVRLKSNATNEIPVGNAFSPTVYSATLGTQLWAMDWSSDVRYIAAIDGSSPYNLQIYSFYGNANPATVGSAVATPAGAIDIKWSPDGRYLAMVSLVSGYLYVYKFAGTTPTLVGFVSVGFDARSVCWSPDGKYLVTVNLTAPLNILIFRFNGSGNPIQVGSLVVGVPQAYVDWSPDGKYLAVTNYNAPGSLSIYGFTGGNPVLVGSASTGSNPVRCSWSPDGRYVAVVSSALEVFRFTGGGNPILVGAANSRVSAFFFMDWSPDGRYMAVSDSSKFLYIYRFNAAGNPILIGYVNTGRTIVVVRWSSDGKYIAVSTYFDGSMVKIYTVNYVNNTQPQAISNSIVFGNSAASVSSDLNVRLFSDSFVEVDGLLNYDNVS